MTYIIIIIIHSLHFSFIAIYIRSIPELTSSSCVGLSFNPRLTASFFILRSRLEATAAIGILTAELPSCEKNDVMMMGMNDIRRTFRSSRSLRSERYSSSRWTASLRILRSSSTILPANTLDSALWMIPRSSSSEDSERLDKLRLSWIHEAYPIDQSYRIFLHFLLHWLHASCKRRSDRCSYLITSNKSSLQTNPFSSISSIVCLSSSPAWIYPITQSNNKTNRILLHLSLQLLNCCRERRSNLGIYELSSMNSQTSRPSRSEGIFKLRGSLRNRLLLTPSIYLSTIGCADIIIKKIQ